MKTKFQKGFTLVELLVVIALVAILAAIAIVIINPAKLQDRAKDGALKATLDKIGLTASGIAVTNDTQNFPAIADLAASLGTNTVAGNVITMTIGSVGSTPFTYFNTTTKKFLKWCSSTGVVDGAAAAACTAGC